MDNASTYELRTLCATLLATALVLATGAPAQAQVSVELGDPVTGAPAGSQVVLPPPPRAIALDPELLALRGEVRGVRADTRRGAPNLGASWGHAAGGFGIGLGVGAFGGTAIGLGACGNEGWVCPIFMAHGASLGGGGLAPFGAAAIVGPVFGALATTFFSALFYQLTSRGTRAPDERVDGVSLAPMLAPVDGGATVGVAGIL